MTLTHARAKPFLALLSICVAAIALAIAPARAQSIEITGAPTIDDVFDACVVRIRANVTAAETRIVRLRDSSVGRLERLAARGTSQAILQRSADKLKRVFPAQYRAALIRLNREEARSMFDLRKHKDYEPLYQRLLDDAIDEALFDVQQLVDEAKQALDDAIVPAP